MTPKILIVDDEPVNQATIEAFLADEGYQLLFAGNGQEALDQAQDEQPDLILLDVMMAEMDGFAVTRRIRSDPLIGRIPIILITALDDERSRLEGLRAGADEFITKPCRREEIRARVRTVVSLNRFRSIAEQREALAKLNAELENLVRARTQQLEEANRLLMSYANFVSHDLRTPLTVVKGYLSMIEDGVVPINAEAAPCVQRAYRASLTMQEMIQNILQLARDAHEGPGDAPPVSTDPTPVLRRLAMQMRELFPSPAPRIDVAELPRVGASAMLIERVFYNLIANALKYSAQRPQPVVEIGAHDSAEGPVLFVRDNGVGFDASDGDKLFHKFSRLSTATGTEGFGLGLSLVATLLRSQGGRIWAESVPGSGATFYVQLPPPAVTTSEPSAASPMPAALSA